MTAEDTRRLAEKIAAVLAAEADSPADGAVETLRHSLDRINRRLDQIEHRLGIHNPEAPLQNFRLSHPSQEKFSVAEDVAGEIGDRPGAEKACRYEPDGRPCDHCSMCSARGF